MQLLVAGVAGIFAISTGLWLYEIWRIGRDMRRERAEATERRLRRIEYQAIINRLPQ